MLAYMYKAMQYVFLTCFVLSFRSRHMINVLSAERMYMTQFFHRMYCKQCCESESAWISTDVALLGPCPYWQCGSAFVSRSKDIPIFTNKPDFKPFKKPWNLRRKIVHVKIQLLMTSKSNQDPDPH